MLRLAAPLAAMNDGPAIMEPTLDQPTRHFFTGDFIKTDLLVTWLDKHGIPATSEPVDPSAPEDDLGRQMRVLVPEADYDRAHQLFFAEREDEL